MATYNGASYEGRIIKAYVTETSTDAAKNTSTISWKIEVSGGAVNYYDAGAYLKINGTVVYNGSNVWNSYAFPAAKGSTSGTMTIAHGSDGTKSIEIDFQSYVYYHTWEQHGGTLDLSDIDRTGPTVTIGEATTVTESSVTLPVTSNKECTTWQYQIGSGDWTTFDTGKKSSATLTLNKLDPNTSYTIKVRATRTHNGITGTSTGKTVSTLGASPITTVNNITFGRTCNVIWTPYNATYKYKVKYECGNQHVTSDFITPGNTNPVAFTSMTIPLNFCNALPTAESGDVTVTLYTYDANGNQIGSPSTKTITGYVPTSVVPSIGTVTATERNSQNPFSVFAVTLSKIRLTAAVTKAYSAAITECKIEFAGYSITYTNDAQTYTLDTETIYSAGSQTYTITVKDARGRTARTEGTVNVEKYYQPWVSVSVYISGTTVTTTVNWQIAPVAGENSVRSLYVDRSDGTTTERRTFTVTGTSGVETWTQTLSDISIKTYTYVATIEDEMKSFTARRTTGTICFSRFAGGKGAAFGKSAERNGLEIDWDTQMNKNLNVSGDLTVGDHDTPVGALSFQLFCSSKSVGNSSTQEGTNLGQITLTPGTYIVVAHVNALIPAPVSQASSGVRIEFMWLYDDDTFTPYSTAEQLCDDYSEPITRQVIFMTRIYQTTTYKFNMRMLSANGSATVTANAQIVRIA